MTLSSRLFRALQWSAPALAGTLAAVAAAPPAATAQPSPYLAPLPAVSAFAAVQKIPVERVEVGPEGTAPVAGDSITALLSLFENDHYRQWLLQLTTLELTTAERGAKPPRPTVTYTSAGTEVRYGGARLALELRLVGPFRDDAPASPANPPAITDKHARSLVNAQLLGLGFDRACVVWSRLVSASKTGPDNAPINLRFGPKPFPADRIAKDRALVDTLGITHDEERSLAGTSPALLAFFDEVQKTPGLREILTELLDKTSLAWSLLTHTGRLEPSFDIQADGISPIDPAKWGPNLPPAYRFPFRISLNEKPSLDCQLVVTAPRPPLLTSAGIIGIVVEPAGDKTKHLVIRVLASRRGQPAESP